MTGKLFGIILLTVVSCATCFAQSSFQGITPGTTELNEVERVLGKPVGTLSTSPFDIEYNPPAGIARVVVGYAVASSAMDRAGRYSPENPFNKKPVGTSQVERIEVYFLKPISRPALIKQFNLPQQADATKTNPEGKLAEYFGGESFLVLTYTSADRSGGVSRIGYYSRELFASVVAKASDTRQNQGTQTSASQSGSGTAALGEMNLPDYMRPPAGSTAATVDRTGRTKPSIHPGATSNNGADFEEIAIDLSAAELRRLVGRYQFTITSVPGLKLAVVGLVSGKLKLTMGTASNTLVPIAEDDFVVGDQGESEVFRFKVAGKRGVKVYFQLSADKVERLYMLEHQRQPKRFSVAVPKP